MEWGTAKGLAVDLGFDQRINDLRYRQEMQKRQQDQNAAKAKMFSDDIDFQNAANSFDAPRVRAANEKITQEIGDFVSSNPDWETNVQKRMYLKSLKNKVKDNPDVIRAVHSDMNYRELLKDLQEVAKNPQQHDADMYNDYLSKWDNYLKYGNQDGQEAASSEGIKPFTYVKPADFVNLDDVYKNAGSSIKNPDIVNIGNGGYYTKPKEADLDARVNSILQQHGRQLTVQMRQQGITDPNEIKKLVRQNVMASFDSDFKLGDQLKAWELGMKQKELNMKHAELADKVKAGQFTPWHYFVDSDEKGRNLGVNPAGIIPKKLFDDVWGGVQVENVKGTDGFKADMTGLDFKPTGRYINHNGNTFINGYIDMTLDDAEARGIYKKGPLTWDEVKPNFASIAKVIEVPNKDGDMQKIVRVNYDLPINRDDKGAMQRFNIASDVDKLVPPSKSVGEESFYPQQPKAQIFYNTKTGQRGVLQPDGSIKPID